MAQDKYFQEAQYARHRIRRSIQSTATPKMAILDALEVIEFVLVGITAIMFTKDGKRKSTFQLVLSIPGIIKFFISIVDMVKKRQRSKLTGK